MTLEPNTLLNNRYRVLEQLGHDLAPAATRVFVLGRTPLDLMGKNISLESEFENYSHSIVAGGLPEISKATREIPTTSLIIRLDKVSNRS